ncbi:hypothetical protein MMC27_007476 [Xylographa pallens]|nr:hypothetical protein [Xylographa pallens]
MRSKGRHNGFDNGVDEFRISADMKREIVRLLWGPPLFRTENLFDEYFKYCNQKCVAVLRDDGQHTSARSHRDIITIVEYLKEEQHSHREAANDKLRPGLHGRPRGQEGEILDHSIDLHSISSSWSMPASSKMSCRISGLWFSPMALLQSFRSAEVRFHTLEEAQSAGTSARSSLPYLQS